MVATFCGPFVGTHERRDGDGVEVGDRVDEHRPATVVGPYHHRLGCTAGIGTHRHSGATQELVAETDPGDRVVVAADGDDLRAQVVQATQGLAEQLDPGPEVIGNGYADTNMPSNLPRDWRTAIEAAQNSAFLKDALGEGLHRTFTAIKQAEYLRVARTIADVDFDLYLHEV